MINYDVDILLGEKNASDAELAIRILKKIRMTARAVHFDSVERVLGFIYGAEEEEKIRRPKLILLDLDLPAEGGLEVLKKLKSDVRTKMIPVIIYSSKGDEEMIRACYQLGANSFLSKPGDAEALAKVISDTGIYWLLLNQPPQY